jgi:hypothetical protein
MEQVSRLFPKILQLPGQALSRVIKGVDLINPKRFLIKPIDPESKAYNETKNEDNDVLLS